MSKTRHCCGKCHDVVSDIVNEAEAKFRRVVNVLETKLKAEQDLNAQIKARFVKCNTCTPDMKDKCPMFHENLCEGERCEELVDLMSLVEKRDLTNVLSLWQQAICEIRGEIKAQETPALVYAKELCDKLESSMVAYAKGDMLNVTFNIGD